MPFHHATPRHPRAVLRGTLLLVVAMLLGGPVPPHAGAQTGPAPSAVLAYGQVAALGTAGLPWLRSDAHLAGPVGLAAEGDAMWVATDAGRNVQRFAPSGVAHLGRAGGVDDLFGRAARAPSDVALLAPAGRDARVWIADRGSHVVRGIWVVPDETSGWRRGAPDAPRSPPVVLTIGRTAEAGIEDPIGPAGAPGADPADLRLSDPVGLATDPRGLLLVGDRGNRRVLVLDDEGRLVARIDAAAAARENAPALREPMRLARHDQVLYIADRGANAVQVWDLAQPSDPRYVRSYGAPDAPLASPLAVATDATFLYVALESGVVHRLLRRDGRTYDVIDGAHAQACADPARPADAWTGPASDLALDARGNLWVALPAMHVVTVCDAFDRHHREDLQLGTWDLPYETRDDLHHAPSGVAVAKDGSVLVAEEGGQRVVAREAGGAPRWTFGTAGIARAADSGLARPAGATALSDGRWAVADRGNGRVVLLDERGAFIEAWDGGANPLRAPVALAARSDGGFWVADAEQGRVRHLDARGVAIGDLRGPAPTAPAHTFTEPSAVATDAAGHIYVSDAASHVVRIFDADGRELRAIGERGVAGRDYSHLDRPQGLAIGRAGRLFVADTGNDRVQVFDRDGGFLSTIGGARRAGSGGLRGPRDLAVAADGRLWVADRGNHRVLALQPVQGTWEPAARRGFGDRAPMALGALEVHRDRLFIGEARAVVGRPHRGASRDPDAGPGAAMLRARHPDGTGSAAAAGAFGGTSPVAITALRSWQGRLFAGTAHQRTVPDPSGGAPRLESEGGGLWHSSDGEAWESAAPRGFGDPAQIAVSALGAHGSTLYAGTRGSGAPPQLWRSTTGTAGWDELDVAGTADDAWRRNWAIAAIQPFSGTVLIGTCAWRPQVWSSRDGRRWSPAGSPAGLVQGRPPRPAELEEAPSAGCVHGFIEHDGWLYAGVGADPSIDLPALGQPAEPVRLLRCRACDGSDWEPAAAPGFGDPTTTGAIALAILDEPPFRFLYAAAGNPATGLAIWRATDGLAWEPVEDGGFGDDGRVSPGGGGALAVWRDRLFLGTRHAAGGADLWSSAGLRPDVVPTPARPTATATPRPRPSPPIGRAAYEQIAAWPSSGGASAVAADVLDEIVDLDAGADGSVYLLDAGLDRVARLRSDGTWADPIGEDGGQGRGAEQILGVRDPSGLPDRSGALAVDAAQDRLYVGDLTARRIAIYDLAGRWAGAIAPALAVDLSLRPDGQLWVADALEAAVRRLAPDGSESERLIPLDAEGNPDLESLSAVVEDDQGRIWVGDRAGARLRAWERRGADHVLVRELDLTTPAFTGCLARRLSALPGGAILAGACLLRESRLERRLPRRQRGNDLDAIHLHSFTRGGAFALATFDADPLRGGDPTAPVVARYADEGFSRLDRWWRGGRYGRSAAPPATTDDPVRLSVTPDGSISLSDALGLRRYTPEGVLIEDLGTGLPASRHAAMELPPALRVANGEPGQVLGVGPYSYGRYRPDGMGGYRRGSATLAIHGRTALGRRCVAGECRITPHLEPIWDVTLPRLSVHQIALTHEAQLDQLVVLQHWTAKPVGHAADLGFPYGLSFATRLLRYPLAREGRRETLDLEQDDRRALWYDVDSGPEGQIVVLDVLNDRARSLDATGTMRFEIDTPKDAWRIAAGPRGEIFVLTTYGHVVRLAPDGAELSRFVGLAGPHVPPHALSDLAVDDAGRVYVADTVTDRVTVFAPEGRDPEVLEGEDCHLSGDKWVAPRDVLLGESVELSLELFGSCGYVERPADIVIAIAADPSYLHDVRNPRLARHLLSLIDIDRHRVGTVAFARGAWVDEPLTHARWPLVRALMDVNAGRIPEPLTNMPGCHENTSAALRAARDAFDFSVDREKILVLIEAGLRVHHRCGTANAQIDHAKAPLIAEGVRIVTVNTRSRAASSEAWNGVRLDVRNPGDGRRVLMSTVDRTWPDDLIRHGTLVDHLPDNMDYVPGSAVPPATWDSAARSVTWDLRGLARTASHRFTLRVRPREEGEWPTNVSAVAQGTDGWGNPIRAELPVPRVRVYGERPPTATPTPTASPTRESTPTPGPTVVPRPIYLPLALRTTACAPDSRNADVVLVLDASNSMRQVDQLGGPSRLEAARAAAGAFVDLLVPGRDQVAVVAFHTDVTVLADLSEDLAAARGALAGIEHGAGTRIDRAIDAASAALMAPARRPTNNAVIVLLTDGAPSGVSADEVVRTARQTHARSHLLFTIGLGATVDTALLRTIASRPEWHYPAPEPSELAEIYARIAFEIPCRPSWP